MSDLKECPVCDGFGRFKCDVGMCIVCSIKQRRECEFNDGYIECEMCNGEGSVEDIKE
jgi:RecJ-like exonuclease